MNSHRNCFVFEASTQEGLELFSGREGARGSGVWDRASSNISRLQQFEKFGIFRCYSEKLDFFFEKLELSGDILTNFDIILNNLEFFENIQKNLFGGIEWPSILFSQY